MTSNRSIAASAASCGPLVTTQATFICGNADIFDSPLSVVSVNTSLPVPRKAALWIGESCSKGPCGDPEPALSLPVRGPGFFLGPGCISRAFNPIIQKHLIRNHRQPMLAAKPIQHLHLSGRNK